MTISGDPDMDLVYVERGQNRERDTVRLPLGIAPAMRRLVDAPPVAALVSPRTDVNLELKMVGGRHVWPVLVEGGSPREKDVLSIVHEQTHAIFPTIDGDRFFNEGAAEFVAHAAYVRVHGGDTSPVATGRLKELAARSLGSHVDVVEESRRDDWGRFRFTSEKELREFACSKVEDLPIFYALGLAYWIDRTDRDPSLPHRLFALARGSRPANVGALVALLEERSGGLTARRVHVETARGILLHALAQAMGERAALTLF
jgi:hypothetical protein